MKILSAFFIFGFGLLFSKRNYVTYLQVTVDVDFFPTLHPYALAVDANNSSCLIIWMMVKVLKYFEPIHVDTQELSYYLIHSVPL